MDADSKLPVVAWLHPIYLKIGALGMDCSPVQLGPEQFAMVRQSDAEAAIAELRAEVERLRSEGANAVRWAASSAHWSVVLCDLFGPDARDGISGLEAREREQRARAEAAEARLERAREFLLGAYRELDAETDSGEELKARIAAFLGEGK